MTEPSQTTVETIEAYEQAGTITGAARLLGITRQAVQGRLRRAGIDSPIATGQKSAPKATVEPLPGEGEIQRYILTCAQNNTFLHDQVWENLMALSDYYDADVLVSRFAYNKSAYGPLSVKPNTAKASDADELWFDERIEDYISDEPRELAPGLVWCGESNVSPTAERPLRGFETYTGRRSSIIPHVKIAMESVASGKSEPTKFNYTTGTVTQLNYIQKKAGQKAQFHHCYGALLVEVDSEGRWWCRQLNADTNGLIYDIDIHVDKGSIYENDHVAAINWGDIHEQELDPIIREVQWGEGGILDTLKPKHQFMHDTLSFKRRNHHDRGNCHVEYQKFVKGEETVEQEIENVAHFLSVESFRDFCKTIVVDSNHDRAFSRWLRECDYRRDHVNALYFLTCQTKKYQSIHDEDPDFHLVEWALQDKGVPAAIRFLREDESFIIVKGKSGGIECGMHGHLGINGARATPMSLSKIARRANTGHTHSCGIYNGLYVAGLSADKDLGYNRGPGTWSHSFIITYPNGKRAIGTIWDGHWRAV